MKRRLIGSLWVAVLVTVAAIGISATSASATLDWQQRVDAAVLEAAAAGETQFFVYLKERADLSGAAALGTKEQKGRYVYEQLRAAAARSQAPVLAELDAHGAGHTSFWVTNAVLATGGLSAIEAVARRDDVAYVYGVGSGKLQRPTVDPPGGAQAAELTTTVFESIEKVNADDAWSLGFRGQGVVVAGADTGVRWTHEAIKAKYRGWNGSTASHDYNWHDSIHNPNAVCPPDQPEPCDDDAFIGGGHGTHTVGTMVGSGPDRPGEKNEFGMAPDAKWIACRNMNNGVGVIPMYLECMQWFLAPTRIDGTGADPSRSPHVVNNSWGCVEVCPPPALQDTLRASRAAGIFYAVSAGNDGGRTVQGRPVVVCHSIYHPLARYAEAFTVGSTQWTNDAISPFSSRGSVLLGDGIGALLKPNVTAPGSSIRSALAANDSSYGSLNGTSMAGPHVAGLVALIISANPRLAGNVDGIEDIIERTAVRKTTTEGCGGDTPTQVPNNTFGWGRIDALAAVRLAAAPDLVVTNMTAAQDKKQVPITATVTNQGTEGSPATTTEFVLDGSTVLGRVATPSLAPGASATVSVVFEAHGPKAEHVVTATADALGVTDEVDERNNVGRLTFVAQGNRVRNPSFDQPSSSGAAPASWSGSSTGAGTTGWSGDSVSITGTGGSALLSGSPSWTSDPVDVTAGEALDLVVSVRSSGLSSAAGAGLVYLGPLGQVVDTIRLISAPRTTVGLETLESTVTIPAGVAQVRVVLTGFAPTDPATAGTVTFDDIGLFAG